MLAVIGGTVAGIYYGFIHVPQKTRIKTSAQKNDQAKGTDGKPDQPPVTTTISVKEPEITHLEDGEIKWQLQAKEVVSQPESGHSELRESKGQIFGEDGRVMTFTAPLTIYDPEKNEIRVQGRFSGKIDPPGLELQGNNLQWNNEQNRIVATETVLHLEDAVVRSDSISIRLDEKSVAFEGNVHIELPLKKPDS